jgi:PAS domain S-box-containing protein
MAKNKGGAGLTNHRNSLKPPIAISLREETMPDNRKEYTELQKKIKSLRLRVAELEKDELRHSRMGAPPKSDLLYQTLIENIHLGITLIDTDYRIITTNVGMGKFFRKPQSEFVGKYCFGEFEKRNAICSHCPGTRTIATGRPAEVQTEGVRDDGSRISVHLRTFPVFESDGSISGFIEIVEDITEYRRAEENLKESEQRFKAIFDNAADGILLADVETKKFYLGNKAICQMLGYKLEEIKNMTIWDIHPKEQISFVSRDFEKRARKEVVLAEDIPIKRKDGSVFYVDLNTFPITLGGKTYLTGIFRDITERKKTEEALRESEIKIRAIFDQTFQFIGLMNIDGVLIEANRTALEFSGIDSSSVLNKPFWQGPWWTHSPELQEKLRQSVEKAARGEFIRFEATHVAKDGMLHYVDFSLKPVKDETGKVIFLIPEGRDITERRKAEEELNIYREKMAQAERLASLGTLSATLAHELTQPLTVIRLSIENSLEDLQTTSCPKTTIDGLRDSLNEVSNATSVVNRFRNFAQQSSRKTLCETNLGAIADRIIKLLGKTAQRAKMTLNLKGLDKLPPVYSNEKDFEQLFFALTENAIQAADGKKNHRLTIEGVVKDKNIELRFADNCSGIAPENLGRIFDPFFTTGSDEGRTGLGLPIVQRIISEYGGKIRVQSQPGKGTTFYVILPIHSEVVK